MQADIVNAGEHLPINVLESHVPGRFVAAKDVPHSRGGMLAKDRLRACENHL